MLTALAKTNPQSDFARRITFLIEQLRAQGADVYVTSTTRSRERGYLMWGAFMLSSQDDEARVRKAVRQLNQLNKRWSLNIPIQWWHPQGWRHTVEAARQMKEAYDVVYASRRGAEKSDHYDGSAADFVALGLPRTLELRAPNGARQSFDLTDPDQARDISLTPVLIKWIEANFHFRKLKSDYPHWNDAAP